MPRATASSSPRRRMAVSAPVLPTNAEDPGVPLELAERLVDRPLVPAQDAPVPRLAPGRRVPLGPLGQPRQLEEVVGGRVPLEPVLQPLAADEDVLLEDQVGPHRLALDRG